MKRFVLLSDSNSLSKGAFRFIQSIYEKEPHLLVGAFFNAVNYGLFTPETFISGADPKKTFTKKEDNASMSPMVEFEMLCNKNNIEHVVHLESLKWDVDEVKKESRFADLILVSSELFFSNIQSAQPNSFLNELLHHAECPVLIVPEDLGEIKRIAIAYNGSGESMFAIKMFSYVFPFYCDLPVEINYWVNKTDDEFPDFDYLEEFAGRHFSNLNFKQLFFDQEKYLTKWLSEKKETMLISGSFHRSAFSTWLKESFIHNAIRAHSSPIFIAHR